MILSQRYNNVIGIFLANDEGDYRVVERVYHNIDFLGVPVRIPLSNTDMDTVDIVKEQNWYLYPNLRGL